MTLISHVFVDFQDENRNVIHRVDAKNIHEPHEAPEGIRKDPIFALLERDGSVRVVYSKEEVHQITNNDPTEGLDATGKKIRKKAAEASSEKTTESGKAPNSKSASEDVAVAGSEAGDKA